MLTTAELRKKQKHVTWERRFQSVMLTLVAAAIIWGVQTLASVDRTQAVVVNRLDIVEIRQAAAKERREADRDHTDLSKRIDATDSAIVIIDGRLKIIESEKNRKPRK